MRGLLDTATMWQRDVNPRYLIQVHRIWCDAQYKVPDATRVLTRIHMMQRLSRVYSGRRKRLVPQHKRMVLDRSLDIPLRDCMLRHVPRKLR